jgi:hypothetical protein
VARPVLPFSLGGCLDCNALISAAALQDEALCDAMRQNPEDVFVLDDVSTLYKNQQGLQVLLAALNGSAGQPRQMNYLLKGARKEPPFEFFGGIVAISNLALHRDTNSAAGAHFESRQKSRFPDGISH